MARVPIARSLVDADYAARVGEWRAFLHGRVVEVVGDDSTARLRLVEGDEAVMDATHLARLEQACCPFFAFDLTVSDLAWWLVISAPDDAAPVHDDLLGLRQA